jgi:hypothetical protein
MPRGHTRSSHYRGVWWETRYGRWAAGIYTPGPPKRMIRIAHFEREKDAAIAHDRVALHQHGPVAPRNFPRRPLRPASIQAIRLELKARTKRRRTSRWNGVYRLARAMGDRRWCAEATLKGRLTYLGNWPTERAAAEAHDRAILYAGGDRESLNFPALAAHLRPADVHRLRVECRQLWKTTTTSRYRGVICVKKVQCWRARITVDRQLRHLGLFSDELEAAKAYDKAAKKAFGERAKLNVP